MSSMAWNQWLDGLKCLCLTLPILLWIGCDSPRDEGGGEPSPAPPISGATLDAIQAEIAERVRLRADGARVERRDEGRHVIIHAKVAEGLGERELAAACDGMRDVFARHLSRGQTAEVYFLQDGGVADSCEMKGE